MHTLLMLQNMNGMVLNRRRQLPAVPRSCPCALSLPCT